MRERQNEGSRRRRLRLGGLAGLGVTAAALLASAAMGAPIASLGPVGSPGGPAATSGTVGPDGQTDACVTGQHSAVGPQDSSNAVQIDDSACPTGAGAASNGSQAGGGAENAQNTRSTSSAAGRSTTSHTTTSTTTMSVAAAQAIGLRIASIRYITSHVKATRRVRVLVTVRDGQRRLVRGATVTLGRLLGAKSTISLRHSTLSNRFGVAGFELPVARPMFGQRLLFTITARTRTSHIQLLGTIRLPALQSH